MTKHTKGPWEVTGQSEAGRYISVKGADNKRTVARVPWVSESDANDGDQRDLRDARLIAAAPEMLAALEEITKELRTRRFVKDDEIWPQARKLYRLAEKVGAKARGELR